MSITVTVEDWSYPMTGRVGAMIVWLARREELVNEITKGRIEFDFAGSSLKVSTRNTEEFRMPEP